MTPKEQLFVHSPPPTVSVAIDPVALVTSECITVTSAMRKNARWAQSSVSAILGGGGNSSYGFASTDPSTPVPGSPLGTERRKGGRAMDLGSEVGGLAGRWGLRGKKGKSIQDNPLIAAFAKLRGDLQDCKDITTFDTPSLLHPFLQVIKSSSTSGPITSLAIIAITKFFSYNLINRNSPRLAQAMQLLSASITHCRFEASDSAQDDVVLLRILKLMEMMISGPGGDLLGDESVCEMMETGLSMCVQTRLSEVLRKSAEVTMVTMCQVVFERLKHLEIEAEEEGADLEAELKDDMETVKIEHAVNGDESRLPTTSTDRSSASSEVNVSDRPTISLEGIRDLEEVEEEVPIRPYSLPSIRELLKVLVQLLDPDDTTHTDTMRVMAMRIIDVAFEVAGPSIAKHSSLAALAKDNLCRFLFQLVKSDVMTILQESLRVTGTLLATTRGVLKLQQELFLSYLLVCLHPPVAIPKEPGIDPVLYEGVPQVPKLVKPTPSPSGRSTPVPVKERQKLGLEGGIRRPDACEAMVECIGALARIPSYMVELYINYDCSVDRNDLCEDVVGFLSRNAFPDSATWSTTNVPPLCLDALLGHIGFICERLDQPKTQERNPDLPDPQHLRIQRERKQVIIRGIKKFNESPKKGIGFLVQQGIIDSIDNPVSIARFVKSTTRISKKLLGEYLSKKENIEILKAFIDQFDFAGKRVDEAVRELLVTFRLPGESALIERIVTEFAEKYCSAKENLKDVANQDAVFILTYAIIMLNTDQHNPNMKGQNRMKYEDFAKNLKGVNDGKDFEPEYVQLIFDAIKNNEIILPDEHDNKHAFDYAWREMLTKTSAAGDMVIYNTNIYDAQMFAATWKPVVATLSYVFMSATDDAVFSRVITGFDQCARISAKYNLSDALDHIIRCLGIISTLSTDSPPSTALNTEVKVHGNSVMVSELAVKFGRDFKAQLATVVLFRVVMGNEGVINTGWDSIIQTWLNLFVNSLIPPFFSTAQNGLDIPSIPLHIPSVIVERSQTPKELGLLSTLSSYLTSYANDDPPEPSEEELDSTLCTVDCVNACYLGDVFSNLISDLSRSLNLESLAPLMASLLRQLPDMDGEDPNIVVVKPDYYPPADIDTATPKEPIYDAAVVYILEFATCLVLKDTRATEAHGKALADMIMSIIRNSFRVHHIVVSRSIYYMFSLLESSYELSLLNVPVVLHSITGLDKGILNVSAQPVIKGLSRCVKGSSSLRTEIINSPDFWLLLRALLQSKEAVADVFSILEYISSDLVNNITSDNYVAVIGLLNSFAAEANIGAIYEQKQDKTGKRSKPPKRFSERPDADVVSRGTEAVAIIYRLTQRVPDLISHSHLEKNEAWTTYWSPILQSLSAQATNPCREVRNQALTYLRQSLLSPELTSDDHHEWTAIFGDVLFPLIGRLLKPETFQSDQKGMSDTRVVVATLLCKIFLHYLVMLSEWEGMLDLWVKILDIMDRLMNSGQGDHLEEAVPESLKNILLVMASGGYLVPPGSDGEGQNEIWEQTWKRLDRFLPEMRNELFPAEPEPASVPVPAASTEVSSQDVAASPKLVEAEEKTVELEVEIGNMEGEAGGEGKAEGPEAMLAEID